jgi:hypothetical protein
VLLLEGEEMKTTIEMAFEAKLICAVNDPTAFWPESHDMTDELKVFEALVRADEREACAKTKAGKPRELKAVGRGAFLDEQQFCFDKGWREGAAAVRFAIRNRGNK